jgi:hypothetical protein
MRMRVLMGALLWSVAARFVAQTSAAPAVDPASFGVVMGQVVLPGSNLPARFASVALQPVDMQPLVGRGAGEDARMPVTVVQTGLDGGFRIEGVAPGMYYVVVNLPGYLSPIAQFTQEQLKHPTPEVQQKIAATVPTVDVRPNSAATAEVRLLRGGSIEGVVRFDDGSPDPAAKLALLQRNDKGRWETMQHFRSINVDDDGRFRVDGLEAGEYTLRLSMELEDKKQSAALGWVTNSSSSTKYSLTIYSGDTALDSEAKALKVAAGEELTGEDITIPVAKLHALSGAVVDAHSGQALNAGRASLVNADGKVAASAMVDAETRTFTFGFAPEGEYTLKVSDAREVEPLRDAGAGHGRAQVKTLRAYGDGAVAVVLHGDVSGLTVPVAEVVARGASGP